jgi:hypothetical protein
VADIKSECPADIIGIRTFDKIDARLTATINEPALAA